MVLQTGRGIPTPKAFPLGVVAVCWGMDSFNLSKILSVVLIFGGVYLVTMSRSRADEERTAAAGGGAKEA